MGDALHGNLHGQVGLESLEHDSRVQLLHGFGQVGHVLPKTRAKGTVIGLDGVGDQIGGRIREVQALDIQLVQDHIGQAAQCCLAFDVYGHHHYIKRLAYLQLRHHAGRAAHVHHFQRGAHAEGQVGVDQRLGDLRPIAQVDRLWCIGVPLTGEIAVDLLGHERRERGQ